MSGEARAALKNRLSSILRSKKRVSDDVRVTFCSGGLSGGSVRTSRRQGLKVLVPDIQA